MHFHHVLLVKADSASEAISLVKDFLEGFRDEVYDWYQFGGRFAWSDLFEKYKDKLIHKIEIDGEEVWVYWNPYHDEEVKGKTWICEFPDGSKTKIRYGDPYPLYDWIDKHPEYSEIINATDPHFWGILKKFASLSVKPDVINLEKHWTKDELWEALHDPRKLREKEKRDSSALYCIIRILERASLDKYTFDSHFFNITGYSKEYDEEAIKREPKKWWLVNLDLHL